MWLKASLLFSLSCSITITSNFSPSLMNSEGCLILLSLDKSDTWTRPSIPSSSSRNNPKFVRFLTNPLWVVPTSYFSRSFSSVHGSLVSCLTPRDIFFSFLSIERITAFNSSPAFMKSEGFLRCCDQDISETWIRPSTPGVSSKNAP